MSEPLFRKEALNAHKNKMMGSVSLYSPPYRWLVIALVVSLVTAIVCFTVLGTYTKKETAVGSLLPSKGIYNITSPVSGTITEMVPEKGSEISSGSVLMTISSDLSTSMGQTRQLVYEQLILQRRQLQTERESENRISTENLNGFTNQLASLKEQMGVIKSQQVQRKQQLSLATEQMQKMQQMRGQGFASNKQVDDLRSSELEAGSRLQDVDRLAMELEQKIMSASQQLREEPLNLNKRQNEIASKLADVERSLVENESQRAVYIKAPQNGTVGATLVKQGQVVTSGQPLIYILPHGSILQAKIMVSSRAIGFINPGQRVMLRYEAYPYQKFGVQHGHVVEVSTAALSPQEVMTITGDSSAKEKLFPVVVELDKQYINLYDKEVALRSGIKLEADFLIEKRRIIEWVFEPLYALGHRL